MRTNNIINNIIISPENSQKNWFAYCIDRKLPRHCLSINVFGTYTFSCAMNIINEPIENSVCTNDTNVRKFSWIYTLLTCPSGRGSFFLRLFRPLQARITVLWRWRWISASNWFHSLSCSAPRMSRPRSWICWILQTKLLSKLNLMQRSKIICYNIDSYVSNIVVRLKILFLNYISLLVHGRS